MKYFILNVLKAQSNQVIKVLNIRMNSQIDFRTLPSNVPSLCIPRVFTNWTETRIRGIFNEQGFGEIERIDVVLKKNENGQKFNRVFIHFKRWFSNQNADMARERLVNGKDIKILYDYPWFWKVSAYREPNKKSDHNPDREERPRATIQFDDDRDRRPIAPSLPKSSHRDEDRRPRHEDRHHRRHQDDSRDRRRDKDRRQAPRDTKPMVKKPKEEIEGDLEKINPTIPETMRIATPEPFVHADTVANDSDVGINIDYGDCVLPTKKRRIVIKKEPVIVKQVPLKIELEEGEVAE